MSVIAFIPARIGSKSIPEKNIKLFCGKPLIFWNLKELQDSNADRIVVATDSSKIKEIVNSFNFPKVEIYDRRSDNAKDNSSTESVMLEYINTSKVNNNDTFMLVQVTSPFTQKVHFNEALELSRKYDSVLSCTVGKQFIWKEDGVALNYDINNRPRRQDYQGHLIENGAFYISTVLNIRVNNNRISGKIGIYHMPDYTSIELDESLDWLVAEFLMKKYVLKNKTYNFSKIKLFLSDVDGVLTDAGMYYTENGDEFKKFCTYDGMAFQILQKQGIKVGIITSEDMKLNRKRAAKIGLDFDFHGVKDKLFTIKNLCEKEKISLNEIAYVGDDINCFELLSNVGFPACPSNAIQKIKDIPNIINLNTRGGEGVVREFIEKILA